MSENYGPNWEARGWVSLLISKRQNFLIVCLRRVYFTWLKTSQNIRNVLKARYAFPAFWKMLDSREKKRISKRRSTKRSMSGIHLCVMGVIGGGKVGKKWVWWAETRFVSARPGAPRYHGAPYPQDTAM